STVPVDSEFGYDGAEVPDRFVPVVFCATVAETGEQYHFWGADPRLAGFIREHADDLFVSHNLIAETKYLSLLGITPPPRWFDTMLAYRYVKNEKPHDKYDLLTAAVKLGLPVHVTASEKKELQDWIGHLEFDPGSPDDRRKILNYCFGDVAVGAALYRELAGS